MINILPKLKFSNLIPKLGLILLLILFIFLRVPLTAAVNAQELTTGDLPASEVAADPSEVSDGTWVQDNDVTFAGKVAARSGHFLDWAIENYSWSFVSEGTTNPLSDFWRTIRNITYAFITLFVLVTAFVIMITRGRNITLMKFIPRFIMIILLITFSFSIVQFIYQIMDAIQGFFFTNTSGDLISQKDLLYVGFDYPTFQGYRLFGPEFDESVFVSLLLVKLTALTYYVMVGVLLLRKIILWFFIIISPIFPLLLFYSPIRNTAKIWIGEFFRWLLYAPIFAIFLSGLVFLWSSGTGIPLKFNFAGALEYPTAISILLGGPGQTVELNNSVNNPSTFALYIVALLMLWVVIILPFLLLQIFLDFFQDFSFSENTLIQKWISRGSSLIGKGTPPPPPSSAPAGLAKPMPFIPAKIAIPEIRSAQATINTQATNIQGASERSSNIQTSFSHASSEVLRLANLSIPTMRDIAKYETSLLSQNISGHQDIARTHETLESIAQPRRVTAPIDRQRFGLINERLKEEARKGDAVASSILSAANSVTSKSSAVDTTKLTKVFTNMNNLENVSSFEEKQKLSAIKTSLVEAEKKGDPLATSVLSSMKKGEEGADESLKEKLLAAKAQGNQLATSILLEAESEDTNHAGDTTFPASNRVQSVSIDDYESVKKIWQENYQKLEPPKSIDGKQKSRKEWVLGDVEKINEIINLLSSSDPQNVSKGMASVGAILPFLLIGGFAQTEVVSYLKAKLEAAKSVAGEIDTKQDEEETLLGAEKTKVDKPKEMTMEEKEEVPVGEENKKINE